MYFEANTITELSNPKHQNFLGNSLNLEILINMNNNESVKIN